MTLFYAFCRTIDDIADDVSVPKAQRKSALLHWDAGLRNGFPETDAFGREINDMLARRGISHDWLIEIIEGCSMDLEVQSFQSWDELSRYNWKVAGVVGLVCTRIFGCVHEDSDRYAKALGNALQLTNILRDVGEDLAKGGRMYLPVNDLIRFQYSERDLVGKVYDGRFLALMNYQLQRAEYLFAEADKLIPNMDRKALAPARIMADIYLSLLHQIRDGGFRVFERRYSVSKLRKFAILTKHLFELKLTGYHKS
jgi:15-cis-phytoene synthase